MTNVIIRKDRNSKTVTAFFPQYKVHYGNIMCYQVIGQHSEASIHFYQHTIKATEQEVDAMLTELEKVGYTDLVLKKKLNYDKLVENWI